MVLDGECKFCEGLFSKTKMVNHLQLCHKKLEKMFLLRGRKNTNFFLIRVEQEPYWIYVQIPIWYELYLLDELLRREWLDCCGHLSCFNICGITYDCYLDGGDDIFGERPENMDVKLRDIISVGSSFSYEYDYGSTTTLKLQVVDKYSSPLPPQATIFAKNSTPEFICENCGDLSKKICVHCKETTCLNCIDTHKCVIQERDEYVMLSLVNSPRTGVCGYEG